MKVIAKPVLRTYEVLLTEEDLYEVLLTQKEWSGSDTIQVTHVDRAPNDDGCMVRICVMAVPEA